MTQITHPAVGFLDLLYPNEHPGYIALWESEGKRTHWLQTTNQHQVAQWLSRLPERTNAYFGLGLHPAALKSGRGEADGVIAIPGLWIDVDITGSAHTAENLPRSIDEAGR